MSRLYRDVLSPLEFLWALEQIELIEANTPRDLMSVVAMYETGFQFAEQQNLRTVQHLSSSQESGVRLAKKAYCTTG
jgi:hypothetical protein